MLPWQSGDAADCKPAHGCSIHPGNSICSRGPNWTRRPPSKRKIGGSSPPESAIDLSVVSEL